MKTVTSALAGAIAAFGLTAFIPEEASAATRRPTRGCEAAAAIKLIGEIAPDDARVRQLTGARTVRRVGPGQSVTMDYRPDRVTLEILDGRIVTASCG